MPAGPTFVQTHVRRHHFAIVFVVYCPLWSVVCHTLSAILADDFRCRQHCPSSSPSLLYSTVKAGKGRRLRPPTAATMHALVAIAPLVAGLS